MDEAEAKQVADAVVNVLETRRTISVATHKKHHDYIETLIVQTKKINDRKESILRGVLLWGSVLMASGIVTAVYQVFIKHNGVLP